MKDLRRCAVFLCALIAWPCISFAATRFEIGEPIFHRVAGAEETPENVATWVTQDRAGFLWIGTPDGVVRYDGYAFRPFRHDVRDPHSLVENHIRTIYPARDGRLWVGTGDDGISIFDPATESFQTFDKSKGLSGNRIRAFADGPPGKIWIATTDGGLDLVDEVSLRVEQVDPIPANAPNKDRARLGSLLVDRRGDLWIGSADGLAVRHSSGTVEAVATSPGPASLSDKPINRIFEARDGSLWIGIFSGGLARYDPKSGTTQIIDPEIRGYEIAQPDRDTVWVGTTSGGIAVFDAKTATLLRSLRHDPSIPESIPSDRINSLFLDRSGILWIGTTGRGLASYKPADSAFQILRSSPARPEGLTSAEVECVFESSDGLLWVGTHDDGVDVFDGTSRVATYRAGAGALDSANIGAIAETPGSIWFGGFGTLNRLDRSSGRIESFGKLPFGKTSGRITMIVPSADGHALWIATNGGLAQLDIATREWSIAEDDAGKKLVSTITDLEVDGAGRLWVATQTGMALLLPNETRFRRITPATNSSGTLPQGSVLDVMHDSKNRIWVGMSNGLLRLESFDGKTAKFTQLAQRLGLENHRFDNLLEDRQGRIWIEDNALFDPATFRIRTFTTTEGAGRSIWRGAATRTRSGQLVLGGPDGLFFIDPDKLQDWTFAPPVALTGVFVNGKRARAAKEMTLDPGTQSVAFEFTALDLAAPHRNRYSYRLRGFDDTWTEVDAGHRTATFTSLPPGDFVFEVKGSNHEGIWSSNVVSIPIRMEPAFYQTFLFRILAALFLVGLTWPLYRTRLRMLEARQQELESIVAARTAEARESEQRAVEASQAKTIFLANMSHELRTPLNATLGFTRLIQRSPTLSRDDRENLSVVERSGQHLLSLINQVLSISKIEAGKMTLDAAPFDLRAMLETIERMFQTRAEEQGIGFSARIDDDVPRHVIGDEGKLRQAIMNLLGNAVKFTTSGNVSFRVSRQQERILFEVEDTGAGIGEAELRLLFQPFTQTETGRNAKEGTGLGLAITKRIVELMGGTIGVESKKGKGTIFRFDVPLEASDVAPAIHSRPRVTRLAAGTTAPRILVADDTLENRVLLVRLLSLVGCEVRDAENGAAAIDAWRQWRPDLIFMDMRMPVMDGREATRAIRESGHDDRTVIVALTASVYVEDRDSLLAQGMDDVLFKPYTEDEIFHMLTAHLGIEFEREETAVEPPSPVRSAAAAVGPARRRVLVTDDDLFNRTIASEALRVARYDVVEATNGEEALELLASHGPFAAMLLDVEMPRMGGIETVRRIRADRRFQQLPVIALTAHSDPDDLARLRSAGMDDHLSKPLEVADLHAKLEHWTAARA